MADSTGAVVSTIVKLAIVVAVLPHSSVAVKVTSMAPVPMQDKPKSWKLWLHVTLPHASLAAPAPPLASSQALRPTRSFVPSHSKVMSVASLAMVGAVVSVMEKVAVVLEEFPLPSVTVKVTVSVPVPPQPSERPVLLWDQVKGPHASAAAAPPLLASQAENRPVRSPPVHSTELSAAATTMIGAVLSTTVTVEVDVALLPQSSVTVRVMVVSPRSKQLKLVKLALNDTDPQPSDEPLSRLSAIKVANPEASKVKV